MNFEGHQQICDALQRFRNTMCRESAADAQISTARDRLRAGSLWAMTALMFGMSALGCGSSGESSAPGKAAPDTADTAAPTSTPDTADIATPAYSIPTSAAPESPAQCATPGLPTTVAYSSIPGVDSNLLSLDIYAPDRVCGAPVVFWVHGGGYQVGDKSRQVANKIRVFNEQGWIFVSVNYRLTQPGRPKSAQFPDHFADIAGAVAWAHSNISSYGGDPKRLALLGHSAGADIVSNVANNPEYLANYGLGLNTLVCAGPLDTEGFDKRQAAATANEPTGEKEMWRAALGNNPNYVEQTSATNLVQSGVGIPATIGVVRGSALRQRIATEYFDALTAAGTSATSVDARSLTHLQVSEQIGAPGDKVMTPPILAFLTRCFS